MEIERKFLVKGTKFMEEAFQKREIVQGYLCSDEKRSVRVRICGNDAFLTIKSGSDSKGWSRYEFEQPIKEADAFELIRLCQSSLIAKTRYFVHFDSHTWEVDVFHGVNEGLTVAEIELKSEDETFELPDWVGKEVSGDARFSNAVLAVNPYSVWNEKVY